MADPKTTNRIFTAAIAVTVVATAIMLGALAYHAFAAPRADRPFSLVDHSGKAVTEEAYKGNYMLVFFGYTYCPDVCPTGLTVMSEAIDALGIEGLKVVPIFISIDPERDTPEVLKEYVENFHPRLVGLTGTAEQVKAAAAAYRAAYIKIQPPGSEPDDYHMGHSSTIYLTSPEGKSLITFGRDIKPEDLAARIKEFMT